MKQPELSVIIPVFNAEKYIERCINSLLVQSFENIEIIAVDDGSTDLSLKVLNQLANGDSRFKIFSQKNAGPSVARNLGIKYSKGKYLTFLDADDWIESNSYEVLYSRLKQSQYPDIVMFNGFKNETIKNKPFLDNGLYNKDEIKGKIYPRLIESLNKKNGTAIRASVWLRLFKRDLVVEKIEFETQLRNNEDLVFCVETTLAAKTFLYIGDVYVHHNCMTQGSLSRGYMKNAYTQMKPLFEILSKISNSYNEYDFSLQIKGRVFRTLIFCIENEFRKENKKSIIQIYFYLKSLIKQAEFNKYLKDYNPGEEKSKRAYYFFFKNKIAGGLMLLAKYRAIKRNN